MDHGYVGFNGVTTNFATIHVTSDGGAPDMTINVTLAGGATTLTADRLHPVTTEARRSGAPTDGGSRGRFGRAIRLTR